MEHSHNRFGLGTVAVAAALTLPPGVSADAACDARKSQVETLQKQLQQLQETLKQYEEKSASPKEVEELRQEVAQAPANSAELKNADSVVHLAGYGDATQQCGGISGG